METYLLIVRSVTQAQHMVLILEKCGIHAVILRAPTGLTTRGCSYAIRIRENQWNAARLCLQRAELSPLGIYRRNGNIYSEVIV